MVLSPSASATHFTIADLPTDLNVLFRQYAVVSLLCHSIEFTAGIGILTDFPSIAPLGFTLGPDLPSAD